MSTVTHRGNKCVSNVRSVLECLVEKSNNFMLEMVPDKVGKDPALGDGRAGRQRFTGQNYIQAVLEQKNTTVFTSLLLLSLCPISCSSDSTVSIFQNAKDSSSTFKFHSFRFQRLEKASTVWLHCEVQVCDGDRLVCQPVSIPLPPPPFESLALNSLTLLDS